MMKNTMYYLTLIIVSFLLQGKIVYAQSDDETNQYTKVLVFHEAFNNNKNGWPVFSFPEKTAKIKNGKYFLKAGNTGFQVLPKHIKKPLPNNFEIKISLMYEKGAENILRLIAVQGPNRPKPDKRKVAALLQKLKKAYKAHQANLLVIRKVKTSYSVSLNNRLIKSGQADNHPKMFRLFIAAGTQMIINDIKISKITLNQPKEIKEQSAEIIIYTPKTERGFVKMDDHDLNTPAEKSISVSGQISPMISNASLTLNNKTLELSSTGKFNATYYLSPGENILTFELTKGEQILDKKQITINYQPDEQNNKAINNVTSSEKRLALVIGNANYQYGGKLANPENDARAIAEALKKTGFKVITYTNLSQKEIKKAIDDFGAQLKNYDVGLFFYAGHGVQVKGSNYLVPVDANINSESDVEYDCVNAERVLARMEDAGSKVNIVILDACRNNPFERSWTRSTQGKGLAFMNAPSGSLIAYATSPGTTASDGTGKNGLYTSALLKHLTTPGITILEMFQRVRATVMEESGESQVPWESTSLRGNFYFVK